MFSAVVIVLPPLLMEDTVSTSFWFTTMSETYTATEETAGHCRQRIRMTTVVQRVPDRLVMAAEADCNP
jgi:hypothetical protein